jgi:hypothetical protein
MVFESIKEGLKAGVVMEAAVKGADESVIRLKVLTSQSWERKSEFRVGI